MALGPLGKLYPTVEIEYAFDIVSTAASLVNLQRWADIISAFVLLFDLEIAVGKRRLGIFGRPWPQIPLPLDDTLTIRVYRRYDACMGCLHGRLLVHDKRLCGYSPCVPIFATTNSPVQVGVVILLMDARDLSLVDGGGPRMMELTMVTAGIILLHQLSKRGHVNTDHQGLVSQLTDSGRIRCTGLMSGSPLVLSACEILQFSQISLHWHRGQPERRGKNAPYGLRKTGGPHLPPRGPAPPSPRSLFPSSLTWRPSTNSLALANVDPSMTSMMTMY